MTINHLEITDLYLYSTLRKPVWILQTYPIELAALEFMDSISHKMDAKKIPFSIFLDLSKAFDTLDHNVLLSKLEYYGIRDTTALNWF